MLKTRRVGSFFDTSYIIVFTMFIQLHNIWYQLSNKLSKTYLR